MLVIASIAHFSRWDYWLSTLMTESERHEAFPPHKAKGALMRTRNKVLIAMAILVGLPSAAFGVGFFRTNTTGIAPEEMRGELASSIVQRWSPYVQETYGVSAADWERQMTATFSKADISNLERAVSAPNYDSMTMELLGGGYKTQKLTAVPGARGIETKQSFAPKALGTAGSDLVFTPLNPCRIIDTRLVGGPIAATATRSFKANTATDFTAQGGAATNCGLPTNASAISVKIVSEFPAATGYFTAYPFNEVRPLASSLNYAGGSTTSDQSTIRLCRPGCTSEFNVYSDAQSTLIVDVDGYYMEPEATQLDCTVVQNSGNLALLGGLQPKSVACPAGYTATGGGCGGPLGISVSNSEPDVVAGHPAGWKCDLVGSLLSVISYQINATCCRTPGR
jgi:hypothetical protein